MTTETAERLLTGHEVATILGRDPQTVRRYARTGKLKSVKVGPHYRYKRSFIAEFLGDNETPAPTPKHATKPSRSPRYSK